MAEFESPEARRRQGWLPGHVDHFVLVAGDARVGVSEIAVFPDGVGLVLISQTPVRGTISLSADSGDLAVRLPPDLSTRRSAFKLLAETSAGRIVQAEANERGSRVTVWMRTLSGPVHVELTDEYGARADHVISDEVIESARQAAEKI